MAKGRIEQEIALKVTGLDDVKSIDDRIATLEKKKHKLSLDVDAGDASKKIGKIDDELAALTKRKLELTLGVDTKAASRDIQDVIDKIDKLGGEPGKILLSSNAAQIVNEIGDLILDIDRLDASDPEIAVKVDQIHALEGDLERLQTKAKELGDTPITLDTSRARTGLDEVGRSADSSKSVLANMVGNSTQDLGALGGVAGSAGVAIGQMGEYMADAAGSGDKLGQIVRGFGSIAVPLAAVGVATQAISGHFSAIAEDEKVANEQAKRFAQSIGEGADEAQVLRDELEAVGELKFRVQIEGLDIDVGDITGPLARAGLDLEGFVALSKLSNEEFRRWADGAEAAGVSSKDLAAISLGLAANFQQQAAAEQIAANNAKVLGTETEQVSQHVKDLNQAYADAKTDTYAAAQELAADAVGRVNDKLLEQAGLLQAQIDAAKAAADSNFANIDAQDQLADATAETNAKTLELIAAQQQHGDSSIEALTATENLEDAIRSERDAIIDAADAAQRLAEDQAAAAGGALTATQKVDAFNSSLMTSARTATPAARQAAYDYLIQVNQIPAEKVTDIQAAIDRGDLAEADRLINEASRTREAAILADASTGAAERDLNQVARDRTAMITAKLNPNYGAALGPILRFGLSANGTESVREPGGIAGEAGGEFIRLPSGRWGYVSRATYVPPKTKVISARRSRSIMRGRSPGPTGPGLGTYAGGTSGAILPASTTIINNHTNVNAAVVGNRYDVARAVGQGNRDLRRLLGSRGGGVR